MFWRSFLTIALASLALAGCHEFRHRHHQPQIVNPFPQLTRVAIAPFHNLSEEPTVDGRKFAVAYFNELQRVPGFEVVPLAVVEGAIRQYGIRLDQPNEARRLAQLLDVDAVVVGGVTEFSPYYPPRCGMQVEWWAANPSFQTIQPGFGLPWGQPEEEFIPPRLVYESELSLAKDRMALETPDYVPQPPPAMGPGLLPVPDGELPVPPAAGAAVPAPADTVATTGASEPVTDGKMQWEPNPGPVMRQTAVYHGNEGEFVTALKDYLFFLDDNRPDSAESYLQRSDDFIRFCCYLHISEMLSARGGAAKTRVVWRSPHSR